MKLFIFLSAVAAITISAADCGEKNKNNTTYKGRLEIKAICSNYTISLLEGTIDSTQIAANWTDETTNKSYRNVFRLGNPCDFPDSLQQGDEFYFTIDSSATKPCTVCMAYYPTPPKAVAIKVIKK